MFQTEYRYTDRKSKAKYVWLKYYPILRKRKILDVGADECHLKQYIDEETSYWGIGKGGQPDQHIELEKGKVPFPDKSFDCVLCLDVLEHLDNIHQIFDECCRVSRNNVIITLPNPWANFYSMLRNREYQPGQPTKFYGLPLDRPDDRHKWFYSNNEAENFIFHRAAKNGMRVVQMDNYGMGGEGDGWRRVFRVLARTVLLRSDLNLKDLYAGPLWAVLEKENDDR
jgi:SAM-dependent methyltransferase